VLNGRRVAQHVRRALVHALLAGNSCVSVSRNISAKVARYICLFVCLVVFIDQQCNQHHRSQCMRPNSDSNSNVDGVVRHSITGEGSHRYDWCCLVFECYNSWIFVCSIDCFRMSLFIPQSTLLYSNVDFSLSFSSVLHVDIEGCTNCISPVLLLYALPADAFVDVFEMKTRNGMIG
jgi:hypothetical protein